MTAVSVFRPFLCPILIALSSMMVQGAVSLTVEPSRIETTYGSEVVLRVSGLAAGETVTMERILDLNGNAVADPGEPVIQRFFITDNEQAVIGGVVNLNVPGDENSADGEIEATLNLGALAEVQRVSGEYVFRATGASGAGQAEFTVEQPTQAQRITGTVTSDGSPVPGALVALLEPVEDGNFLDGTFADGSGDFSIDAPVGMYIVASVAPGFFNAAFDNWPMVNLNAGQNAAANLTLEQGTGNTLSGRLFDAENSSIGLPGVPLFMFSEAGGFAVALTDFDGTFSATLPPGLWEIELSMEALASLGYLAPDDDLPADNSQGPEDLEVPLTKATALIYGEINGAGGGVPVPGIRLEFRDFDFQYEAEVISRQEGKYAVGVEAGSWRMDTDREDPALAGLLLALPDSVEVSAGEAVELNLLAHAAEWSISGSVRDSEDDPIPNVGVFAGADIDGQNFNSSAETDAEGNFVLRAMNGVWIVGVSSEDLDDLGFRPIQTEVVSISNADATVDLVVRPPTAHIRGQVVDETGSGRGFLRIQAFPQEGGSPFESETDANGNFALGVNGGTWFVQLEGSNAAEQGVISPVLTVTVPENESVDGVELVARRTLHGIQGSLQDSSGAGISGVRILATIDVSGMSYSSNDLTDSSGHFSLPVFNGSWIVRAISFDLEQRGFQPASSQNVTINDADATIEFVVSAQARIRGRVVDETGASRGSVKVLAFPPEGGAGFEAETDGSGNFDLGVNGGTWNVRLESASAAQQGLISPSLTVTVPEEGSIDGLEMVARLSQQTIQGTIKDSSGTGIGGVVVSASIDVSGTSYSSGNLSDSSGNFSLPAFNGTWNVRLNSLEQRGFQTPPSQNVTINDADATIEFVVSGSHIRGKVVDDVGTPRAFVQIMAFRSEGGGVVQTDADSNGDFDLGVIAGTWIVELGRNSANQNNIISPSITVTVPEDESVEIEIVAPRALFAIDGTLRNSSGTGIGDVWVFASITANETEYNLNARTDSGGSFSFPAFNGTWTLTASSFDLEQLGYFGPPNQDVTVNDADATVIFTASSAAEPPSISHLQMLPNGTFQFRVNDVSSRTLLIQASSDLKVWGTLEQRTTGGSFEYTDELAPSGSHRFYRVIRQ